MYLIGKIRPSNSKCSMLHDIRAHQPWSTNIFKCFSKCKYMYVLQIAPNYAGSWNIPLQPAGRGKKLFLKHHNLNLLAIHKNMDYKTQFSCKIETSLTMKMNEAPGCIGIRWRSCFDCLGPGLRGDIKTTAITWTMQNSHLSIIILLYRNFV